MSMNKIDIVYTWIDGQDAKWMAKKESHLAHCQVYDNCYKSQAGSERFTDNQELKYSLRSIELFAPWVNHIYIITDAQKPKWLKDCSKVTIIDHSEIIPREFLPTFNSSVIEAHLHLITNLEEKFIYFNDDMFLGKPTSELDFFRKDKPYIFTSSIIQKKNKKRKESTYNVRAINLSRHIVQEKNKIFIGYGLKHGIRPLLKSRLKLVSEIYSDHLIPHYKERFRLNPFSLIYLYTFHELAVKNANSKYLQNINHKKIFNFFPGFCYIKDSNILEFSLNYTKKKPLVFCINELSKKLELIPLFSNGIFSKKSKFEQ